MGLFAGLKKIREFERTQLPFLKTLVDFDIVIEIGYAEEQQHPLTLKQLFLLEISSRSTVRRRLAQLIAQGIVTRRRHANDHRATVLTVASSSLKVLTRYCSALASICALNFK